MLLVLAACGQKDGSEGEAKSKISELDTYLKKEGKQTEVGEYSLEVVSGDFTIEVQTLSGEEKAPAVRLISRRKVKETGLAVMTVDVVEGKPKYDFALRLENLMTGRVIAETSGQVVPQAAFSKDEIIVDKVPGRDETQAIPLARALFDKMLDNLDVIFKSWGLDLTIENLGFKDMRDSIMKGIQDANDSESVSAP